MPQQGLDSSISMVVFHPGRGWFKNELEMEVAELLKLGDATKYEAKDLENMSKEELDKAAARIEANASARQRVVAEWERQDQDQLGAVRKAAKRRQQNEEVMAVRGEGPQEH